MWTIKSSPDPAVPVKGRPRPGCRFVFQNGYKVFPKHSASHLSNHAAHDLAIIPVRVVADFVGRVRRRDALARPSVDPGVVRLNRVVDRLQVHTYASIQGAKRASERGEM